MNQVTIQVELDNGFQFEASLTTRISYGNRSDTQTALAMLRDCVVQVERALTDTEEQA